MATWKGRAIANVRNWCAAWTAATSGVGPVAQPIFQPVKLKVLPVLERVSVRSNMSGSVAMGTCGTPSNVRYS